MILNWVQWKFIEKDGYNIIKSFRTVGEMLILVIY